MSEKVIVKSGVHIHKGHTYYPGDVYPEVMEDIPEILRNRFRPAIRRRRIEQEEQVDEKEIIEGEPIEDLYKTSHRGGGRWNVIHIATDKPVNDEYLTKEKAKELAEDLNG